MTSLSIYFLLGAKTNIIIVITFQNGTSITHCLLCSPQYVQSNFNIDVKRVKINFNVPKSTFCSGRFFFIENDYFIIY